MKKGSVSASFGPSSAASAEFIIAEYVSTDDDYDDGQILHLRIFVLYVWRTPERVAVSIGERS